MRTIKVVTNKTFEKYIDYLARKEKFESMHRFGRCKFEGQFDDLELDDITTDVKEPTQGEINNAIRELDIFDDVAAKVNATDVGVGSDGKLRILDFDDEPSTNKSSKPSDEVDARISGLDYDNKSSKGSRGRGRSKKSNADNIPVIGELDYDDKGKEVTKKKSNIGGVIGALDYDDDIDVSKVAASIDDVYKCLSSEDVTVVKSMIKRYASDITDEEKIKDVMLIHATNLNLSCLKVMCGDMDTKLTKKEKELEFIDKDEIDKTLRNFRKIASELTGANNTYGLIPNAIVSCTSDDGNQTACQNVVDFLKEWCKLPIIPLYVRGAMIRHCYSLAKYLFKEVGNVLPLDILTGPKGLINRMKELNDIPIGFQDDLLTSIAENKNISSNILGDLVINMAKNGNEDGIDSIFNSLTEKKATWVRDYVEDTDLLAFQTLQDLGWAEEDDDE